MPQVDSEPLPQLPPACHVSDRRITCVTLADELRDQDIPESTVVDYAPESFWLSKDSEFDWFDRNAFLDRNESIKGNSNSIHLNPIVTPNGNVSALQISFLNSKAVVKTNNIDSKRRNCKLKNILLFPKRSDSIGNNKEPAVLSMTEPSSPKVSCLGRVRSKNCPRRRNVNRPVIEPEKVVTRRKTGFMCCVRSLLFRSSCYGGGKSNGSSEYSVPGRNNVTVVGRTDDLRLILFVAWRFSGWYDKEEFDCC
ncbi:uncharacterized protein LOC143577437 [Bidens hawaiensis]|uniref:uncharacterized protein LOC143577437 n=1 Tax=Bidens hawaiensis TaxID=980011 RepID=UPI004049DBBD